MKKFMFTLLAAALLTSCGGSDNNEIAYFKNAQNFRVYVVETTDTTQASMDEHAVSKMNTAGRPTVVYYYTPGNAINPTALNDFNRIIDRCDASNYYYRWWKNPSGTVVYDYK